MRLGPQLPSTAAVADFFGFPWGKLTAVAFQFTKKIKQKGKKTPK